MKPGDLEKKIAQANEIHGYKYNYDKVIENKPKTVKDKIIITCPKHGDFVTTFDAHINKRVGCQYCKGVIRRTHDEYISECKEVHKDKNYDLSNTVFTGMKKYITVICHNKNILGEEHGEFKIRADHFLNGHGCPKCANRYLTTEEVIAAARKVHGDKYDYSKLEYHNDNSERLPIICHEKDEYGIEHGIFTPVWYSHLQGVGCPKCNGGVKWNKEKFLEEAHKIHGDTYIYDEFEYVNANTDGIIICRKHGPFLQSPYEHIRMGHGCPKCKASKLEQRLIKLFNENKVDYVYQATTEVLGQQTIDFYIPSKKLYIECQGEQHYVPVRFGGIPLENAEAMFEKRKKLDEEKYNYAIKKGCEMIYFTMPDMFIVNDINVHDGFYSNKKVFENAESVLDYIFKAKDKEKVGSVLDNFRNDLINVSSDVVSSDNRFVYRNHLIYFNDLSGDNKDSINSNRRHSIAKGYKVINIFEDEYLNHRDIVLSKIRHIFGLDNDKKVEKISGRKCTILECNANEAETFLNKNHIQGFVSSTLYLKAVYDGKTVAIMSLLQETEDCWNLNRFASLNGCVCRGIGGKLFKHFIRKYNPIEVKSFADVRWTENKDDNLYTKLGFEFVEKLNAEYRYYKPGETKERMHKFGFRKQTLNKKYGLPLTMTEKEMTEKLGYYRIWDCGLFKYVWKKEKKDSS